MPNGSRTPCTTRVGTVTASSSGNRLGAGAAPDLRGGCSGNARQSTPVAPVAPAVRQATRAPEERPPTSSGRPSQRSPMQMLDDGDPRGIELMCECGRASSRHAVGLLDEHHADPERARNARHRDQISRPHPSARTVSEHEPGAGIVGRVQVRVRATVRSLDCFDVHPTMVPASQSGSRGTMGPWSRPSSTARVIDADPEPVAHLVECRVESGGVGPVEWELELDGALVVEVRDGDSDERDRPGARSAAWRSRAVLLPSRGSAGSGTWRAAACAIGSHARSRRSAAG